MSENSSLINRLSGPMAIAMGAAFLAWMVTSVIRDRAAPAGPPSEEREPEIPDSCRGWEPAPPRPPSAVPGPDDFPPGQWTHLACSDGECIAKAQANAFRFGDGMFGCDFDDSMASEQVLCFGSSYDEDDNMVAETVISCPATQYSDCELVERRPVFVPHRIVPLRDVAEAFSEPCEAQLARRRECGPWCGGPDPDPRCSAYWSVTSSCVQLAELQHEMTMRGEWAVDFFERPERTSGVSDQ